MKNLFFIVFIIALFYGYNQYQNGELNLSSDSNFVDETPILVDSSTQEKRPVRTNTNHYSCDGRQYCSQMRSCEEATYFITHCPNTKMDGNQDGIPCEKQWCD